VSGAAPLMKLKRSAIGSAWVVEARLFLDLRLSELERDWRLLLELEVEVDVEEFVVVVDADDCGEFPESLGVSAVGLGVVERLFRSFAFRICGLLLKERSSSRTMVWVLLKAKSRGSSGVVEEQLDSELSSEDLAVGVLAREFDVVVFVERDLEERRGSCTGPVCCGCGGWRSSSMTSTTCPSGATTS
jgi:hypothetical protein